MSPRSTLALCISSIVLCASAGAGLTRYIDLPAEYVSVTGMSADGAALLVSNPFTAIGWIWRDSTGLVRLPDAIYPRHGGLNHDGSLVVGGRDGIGAFRLQVESMQFELPPSNSPDARALAISPDGQTVLYTSDGGTFLWKKSLEIRIADFRVSAGNISDDGRVVGLASGYFAAVWTHDSGLQQLDSYYVRELHISSDGTTAVALDGATRRADLRFWHISETGVAAPTETIYVDAQWDGGASPDCSIIGLYGGFSPYYAPLSVWTRENGAGFVTDFFEQNGAGLPGLNTVPGLEAISASNRIFAGASEFVTRDYATERKIWLVDLDRSCPGEFTFDVQVDDADFLVFVAAYDAYLCPEDPSPFGCQADLDHNGFVDDADFAIFVIAYDVLLCP